MNETAIKILEGQYKILPGLRWFMMVETFGGIKKYCTEAALATISCKW